MGILRNGKFKHRRSRAETISLFDEVPKKKLKHVLRFFSGVNLKRDSETQEVGEAVKAKQQELCSAFKHLFDDSNLPLGRIS